MNNPLNTVFVVLCCVLLLSYPLGFVAPANAASPAPKHHVDFCDTETTPTHSMDETQAAAEEVYNLLPRWYQDVARGNVILVNVYAREAGFLPISMYLVEVGTLHEIEVVFDDFDRMDNVSLTVNTQCHTLNRVIASDDKTDAIVDEIWHGNIQYHGHGPGADAAVVYADSLLTGAYVLENRQVGNIMDFLLGTMAPVTKTYDELWNTYQRFFPPFEDPEVRRPGGN